MGTVLYSTQPPRHANPAGIETSACENRGHYWNLVNCGTAGTISIPPPRRRRVFHAIDAQLEEYPGSIKQPYGQVQVSRYPAGVKGKSFIHKAAFKSRNKEENMQYNYEYLNTPLKGFLKRQPMQTTDSITFRGLPTGKGYRHFEQEGHLQAAGCGVHGQAPKGGGCMAWYTAVILCP